MFILFVTQVLQVLQHGQIRRVVASQIVLKFRSLSRCIALHRRLFRFGADVLSHQCRNFEGR